ncbi:hypothetical protein HK096_006319, partial [Nowakowskiella sp. JEL0078]
METVVLAFLIYRFYWRPLNHPILHYSESSGKTSLQSSEKIHRYPNGHSHNMSFTDLSLYRMRDMENLRARSATGSIFGDSLKSLSLGWSVFSQANPSGVFIIGESENGSSKASRKADTNSVLSSNGKGSGNDSHIFVMSEASSPGSSKEVQPGSDVNLHESNG